MRRFTVVILVCVVLAFLVGPVLAQQQPAKPQVPQKQEEKKVTAKVNINKASEAELAKLPQIGPAMAKEIVAHRTQKGPFKKIEDIKQVKGIGEKKFEAIKDLITVE